MGYEQRPQKLLEKLPKRRPKWSSKNVKILLQKTRFTAQGQVFLDVCFLLFLIFFLGNVDLTP